MGRISNALLMLKILSSGKKYTIKELSLMLEVSPRMVRQYKEDLEKAGIFVEASYGVNGGYCYNNNSNYDFNFSLDDLRCLENLQYSQALDKKTTIQLDSIIEKVRCVVIMDKYSKKEIGQENKKLIEKIKKAINSKTHINILTKKGQIIHLLPLYINIYRQHYFVTGFVEELESLRTYSLLEIKNIF